MDMDDQHARTIFDGIQPLDGFHEFEKDLWGAFVWAAGSFSVRRPRDLRFAALHLCYYGHEEKLFIRSEDCAQVEITLYNGWNTYAVDLSGLAGEEIRFELARVPPVEGDNRDLGVMIRWMRSMADRDTYELVRDTLHNKVLNDAEYIERQTELTSFPPQLRLSLVSACNIVPRCVYCDWEPTRNVEISSDFRFSADSLLDFGDFYRRASMVMDCSIGEPLLSKDFGSMAAEIHRSFKYLEFTTNGLLLGPERRNDLLGKRAIVCVSLDSATAEGYARYRNREFDTLLENLQALCRDKKEHNDLPHVLPTFIAMKSNLDEAPAFLRLMKEVGVDGVKLRSLNLYERLRANVVFRHGFRFDYEAEALSLDHVREVTATVHRTAADIGLPLIPEMEEFGTAEDQSGGPPCSLPWKSMYVLNGGLNACCYMRIPPLARWSERRGRPYETFLRDVWNGPAYRNIRSALADGILPRQCLDTKACPIVRKQAGKEWG